MDKLPKLTTEPVLHIDSTPNNGYAIRILKAYRENCNCKWSNNTSTNDSIVFAEMNRQQDERAKILDYAIKILENATFPEHFPLNKDI